MYKYLVLITISLAATSLVADGDKRIMTGYDTAVRTNRLINETSPYLLQHANNPVDLLIGYSTCHWYYVMERESLSNEQITKIMNEHFVSIKIDREKQAS